MPAFINGRFLTQPFTGVQKYAAGLSLHLQRIDPSILVVVPPGKIQNERLATLKTGKLKGILWEQIELPLFLSRNPGSVLINFCNTAPLLFSRQIVTIHDLAFEQDEKWVKNSFRLWYKFMIPRIARTSLMVLTVSEFIKNEIRTRYHTEESKIHVIPNGILMNWEAGQPVIEGKYLLLTGIHNPRKNTEMVIRLLPDIMNLGYKVVTTGSPLPPFRNSRIPESNGLIQLGYVDELVYGNLVQNAAAMIYPSKYEGFGVPVLESILSGVNVIASDLEVFRESFGEIPLYFSDESELIADIKQLDKNQVNEDKINTLRNIYNFAHSAEKLYTLIKDLI
jgi:glycosyltransferase involved in cell wall biosynthesis